MPAPAGPDALAAARRRYAAAVCAGGGAGDAALQAGLEQAFATVPREAFMAGPPPWRLVGAGTPRATRDPLDLYDDLLVVLDAAQGINNGQPSLHARCLGAARPGAGDTVLHMGAGCGYYSAILAELVGAGGEVLAYEIDPALAACARQALRPWPQARVIAESALGRGLPQVDLLYASASVTTLPAEWLAALRPGGRAVLPLAPPRGWGLMLWLQRAQGPVWPLRVLARVAFVGATGPPDLAAETALAQALRADPQPALCALRWGGTPEAGAWLRGPGWWLSTLPPSVSP